MKQLISLSVVGLLLIPAFAFAQSTLIPCGFDTNDDKVVKNLYDEPAHTISHKEECDFNDLITLAQNVINFLIFKIASPLAAVMFAYAGFLYVTNRGNEGQVKQAHDIFWFVFWGLVVALAAWIMVNFVLTFFLDPSFIFLSK
jgi:hypothetical protein